MMDAPERSSDRNRPRPSRSERDVLLAATGELPWWNRLRLSRRLARDPEARRQAEALSLLFLLAGAQPRLPKTRLPGPRVVRRPLFFSLAAAAVLLVVGVLVLFPHAAGDAVANTDVETATPRTPDEPLHATSCRLLLASLAIAPPVPLPARLGTLPADEPPFLPPWSRALPDRVVLSLSTPGSR